MNMKKVLIDTNFLLIPVQFKVDIFSEIERICDFDYKLYILDKTTEELESIIKTQKGKSKDAAKLALRLIVLKGINTIKTEKNVYADTAITNIAAKEGFIVATQDKGLKMRLKAKNVPIMTLRQKKYVIWG